MNQGWVYVLVNSSIPGMAKVGRTTRPPTERAAELSGATGVATPFVLAFEQEFADCVLAEQEIHAELDRRRMRVAANREFFRGSPAEIVHVILQAAAQTGVRPAVKPAPSSGELLALGDRHLFGYGDTLQDVGEAVRIYRQAASRGSLMALERLGSVYGQARRKSRADRQRAMRYLREGTRRGNYYCFVEMAALFALEGHGANFVKVCDSFFNERLKQRNDEIERDDGRYITALRRYLCGCLDLQLRPAHMAELVDMAEPLVAALMSAMAEPGDAPEARMRLAGALRWVYENLLPPVPEPEPAVKRRWRLPSWVVAPLTA